MGVTVLFLKLIIMKKRILITSCISAVVIFAIVLININGDSNEYVMHPIISKILEVEELEDCRITKLAEYSDISYTLPNCNEDNLTQHFSNIAEGREMILEEIIQGSTFEINEEAVLNRAYNQVIYYESQAEIFNLSLEAFCVQQLGVEYVDFYDMCYIESENYIKEYLVIGAISYIEFPEKTEEEILSMSTVANPDIYYCYQQLQNYVYSMFFV